eukprot:4618528-Pleurochrysis_carterae.AAC.1
MKPLPLANESSSGFFGGGSEGLFASMSALDCVMSSRLSAKSSSLRGVPNSLKQHEQILSTFCRACRTRFSIEVVEACPWCWLKMRLPPRSPSLSRPLWLPQPPPLSLSLCRRVPLCCR